jgi:hypothetical protein
MTGGWNVFTNNTQIEIIVFSVSGTFALLSLMITVALVFRHLKHWYEPEGQKPIVRILLMVPIYSVVSFMAILFGDYALYFSLVRDCYESYVLYQFFCLLIHYFGKEAPHYFEDTLLERHSSVDQFLEHFEDVSFPFPLCWLQYRSGERFFKVIKRCVLQYVLVKPTFSAIAILCHLGGVLKPSSFDPHYANVYITSILNFSASLAFYFIVLFYDLIKDVIKPYSPLLKLISIKILVFFIFWQSITLAVLYYFQWIPAFFGWSTERSSDTVQNVLVCIEMFVLSIFNIRAFNYQAYRTEPGEHTLQDLTSNIQSVVSQKDLMQDTKEAFHPTHLANALKRHTSTTV